MAISNSAIEQLMGRYEVSTQSEVMKLSVSEHNGIPVLHIFGTIDVYTSLDLRKLAFSQIKAGKHRFVIDLLDVEYIDDVGLGTLTRIFKRTRELNGNISLVTAPGRVQRAIEITGLYRIFDHFPSIQEATERLLA